MGVNIILINAKTRKMTSCAFTDTDRYWLDVAETPFLKKRKEKKRKEKKRKGERKKKWENTHMQSKGSVPVHRFFICICRILGIQSFADHTCSGKELSNTSG